MKQLITLLAVAVIAMSASADLVVNLVQGDITADTNLTGGQNGYSSSTISPASNYTGPTFFGGAMVHGGTGGSIDLYRLEENGDGDYIRMRSASGTVGAGVAVTGLTVFDTTAAFALGDINSLDADFFMGGGGINTDARIVIQANGSMYISSLVYDSTSSFTISLDSTALDALSWYSYSPNASDIYTIGSLAALTGTESVTDIGIWWEATDGAGDENISYAGGGLKTFSVDAVVPEPATVGMLGLGALVSLLVRRIRN